MPPKTLPDEKVRPLLDAGHKPSDIARILAQEGIHVSAKAISMFAARNNYPAHRPRYDDLIPWVVKPEHKHKYMVKMLRREGQRRAGLELTEAQLRELDNWKRKLEEMCDGGAVVDYRPDRPEGWVCVRRRPGIDTDLIRVPSE